jgi:hypothetical protein
VQKLLENDPAVTRLLERNPFPDKRPVFVRAVFYDYTYSAADEKAKGIWWDRRRVGLYMLPVGRPRLTARFLAKAKNAARRVPTIHCRHKRDRRLCDVAIAPCALWLFGR